MLIVNLPVAKRAHMLVGVGQGITERENKTIKLHTNLGD